jgi:hypothetical protein
LSRKSSVNSNERNQEIKKKELPAAKINFAIEGHSPEIKKKLSVEMKKP